MTDREKVIKGLECCQKSGACFNVKGPTCPYYIKTGCADQLIEDAYALLKEQEQQINQLEHDLAVTQNSLNYYINGND